MAKDKKNEILDTVSKMDSEQIEALAAIQQEQSEKNKEVIKKVIAHKFKGELSKHLNPLKRGEKKELKKNDIDIKSFNYMTDDEKDELLDKLIEIRGVESADDIEEAELMMWMTFIVLRAISYFEFEGN